MNDSAINTQILIGLFEIFVYLSFFASGNNFDGKLILYDASYLAVYIQLPRLAFFDDRISFGRLYFSIISFPMKFGVIAVVFYREIEIYAFGIAEIDRPEIFLIVRVNGFSRAIEQVDRA